mgnify:FL=1
MLSESKPDVLLTKLDINLLLQQRATDQVNIP